MNAKMFLMNIPLRVFLVCIIALIGVTGSVPRARSSPSGQFEEGPCPMPLPEGFIEGSDIRCGYLTVPEDHTDPGGQTIQIAIAILLSSSADPAPDPLIMVRGGPGESALSAYVPLFASSFGTPFLEQRDVILVEQRGTYYSKPALLCSSGEDLPSCRDRLLAEGVDLQAYNTANNAADIAMVMHALGYDRYNLYGVSYGTILAQYVLRDNPGRLRSVILDSVLPIALDPAVYGNRTTFSAQSRLLAVQQLFADCASDPACSRFYPDLETTVYQLIVGLDAEPVTLTYADPEASEPCQIELTGQYLLGQLFQGLYSDRAAEIPLFAGLLTEGEYDLLFGPEACRQGESRFSQGMHMSVNCSTFPASGPAGLQAQGLDALIVHWVDENVKGFSGACEIWGAERAQEGAVVPVKSDVPVLLMSGELDPNTPPRNAEIVAEYLDNTFSVAFPGLGHETLNSSSCARSIALRFLEDPMVQPDTACLGDMKTSFVAEPIAARLLALQRNPPFLRLGLLLASVLLMISALVVWPIVGLRARGRESAPRKHASLARWLAGTAAALNIVFLLIFVASNPTQIVYGYPMALRLGMLLPLIAVLPTVGALLCIAPAWKRGYWGVAGRIHFTLVSVAAAVLIWQLDYWHLLGWRL